VRPALTVVAHPFDTQTEAIEAAHSLAESAHTELTIHGDGGRSGRRTATGTTTRRSG